MDRKYQSGQDFSAKIRNIQCNGKIYISPSDKLIYLMQDVADGRCPNEGYQFKFGYSWAIASGSEYQLQLYGVTDFRLYPLTVPETEVETSDNPNTEWYINREDGFAFNLLSIASVGRDLNEIRIVYKANSSIDTFSLESIAAAKEVYNEIIELLK